MSLFDLGQQFRAASSGTPQPRLRHSPIPHPHHGTAVHVRWTPSGRLQVFDNPAWCAAANTDGPATSPPDTPLAALPAPGGFPDWPRLIVPTRDDFDRLVRTAAGVPGDGSYEDRAALVAWWRDRADHPDSGAVIALTDALTALLAPPNPSRSSRLGYWQQLLARPPQDRASTDELWSILTEPPALPGLNYDETSRSWGRLLRNANRFGWSTWRHHDTVYAAVVGLESRSASADRWERALISDPIWAERERHTTGRVVDGTFHHTPERHISTTQELCRYREGDTGIIIADGGPNRDTPIPVQVKHLAISADRHVTLGVEAAGNRPALFDPKLRLIPDGTPVRLLPDQVSANLQSLNTKTIHDKMRAKAWITLRDGTPTAPTRQVPLRVLARAAPVRQPTQPS